MKILSTNLNRDELRRLGFDFKEALIGARDNLESILLIKYKTFSIEGDQKTLLFGRREYEDLALHTNADVNKVRVPFEWYR